MQTQRSEEQAEIHVWRHTIDQAERMAKRDLAAVAPAAGTSSGTTESPDSEGSKSSTLDATMSAPLFPGYDGLMTLSRREGVDIRPTLLRVLVDLYVQARSHTADEVRQFVELAIRLIDQVDEATRAAVRSRLTTYAATPVEILDRLGMRRPDADQVKPIATDSTVNGSKADWDEVKLEVLKILQAESLDQPASHLAYVRNRIKPVFDHVAS
jgi:hypothetical protein